MKHQHKPNKKLLGVSGTKLDIEGEADVRVCLSAEKSFSHRVCIVDGIKFPGDMLIGMDILRRANYTLVHRKYPPRNFLYIDGVKLPVTFTDCPSLGITVLNKTRTNNINTVENQKAAHKARVRTSVTIKPKSG